MDNTARTFGIPLAVFPYLAVADEGTPPVDRVLISPSVGPVERRSELLIASTSQLAPDTNLEAVTRFVRQSYRTLAIFGAFSRSGLY